MLFAMRNLRASRVNLLMNDFAAGLPSPLSFLGLADALARDLELPPWSARTLPVLHRVEVSKGRTRPEMELKSGKGRTRPEMELKSGAFMPIETMEDLTGTVDVSILIDLPGCNSETTLQKAMYGRRIAGGILQNDDCEIEEVTPDGGGAFRGMRRGYALVPASDALVPPDCPGRRRITTGDEDGLTEIAATLFPAESSPGSGWIVPVAAGYHLIENPDTVPERIRTRSRDVPHVFAEPVLGIAELISVRNDRLTSLTEDGLKASLWSWEARGDYILGHRDYHPATLEQKDQHHA